MLNINLKIGFKSKVRFISLFVIIFIVAQLLSGCGFQLAKNSEVPPEFKTIRFYPSDKYGTVAKELRSIFKANHVNIVNESVNQYTEAEKKQFPAIYILNTSSSTNVTSIFPNGTSAESQMRFILNGKVIKDDKVYPVTATINRIFFDNPATALAKSTEEDLIQDEMYRQAAEQFVQKLYTVSAVDDLNQKQ